MNKKHLLVLNTGSSSLKFSVFELNKKSLGSEIFGGSIQLFSGGTLLSYHLNKKKYRIKYSDAYNLKSAWRRIDDLLIDYDLEYIGFRMVHGGEEFIDTTKINSIFLKNIIKYNKFAPLHNPPILDFIHLVRKTWPRIKMSVSFDTAWYKNLRPEAYLYSIPIKFYKKNKIRKYGFHGLNHEIVTNIAAKKLGKKMNNFKAITCHLGSGCSLTWYADSRVLDTTMGFSPNEGLTMSTRSGDVPASVIFYLASELKMTNKEIQSMLNKRSGLFGLSNMRDLRDILSSAGYKVKGFKASQKYTDHQKKRAKLALEIFVYDIARHLASYIGMSKKLDAIVFTGGIGYNSAIIRKMVLDKIQKPKKCKVLVIEEAEMINIAKKTILCLNKK